MTKHKTYDKLIFVGRNIPRRYPRGYCWALTWGYVTFSDDDGIPAARQQLETALARAIIRNLQDAADPDHDGIALGGPPAPPDEDSQKMI